MWGILAPNYAASDHFQCHELACRHCARIVSLDKVEELAHFLEGVRKRFSDHFGWDAVMHIDSAHRCPEHNKAIGGAEHSQHPLGNAADIIIRGLSPDQTWEFCKKLQEEGIIGGVGHYPSFTHIDHGPKRSWNGS